MAVLHCRHCGIDNQVASDVIGNMCENCGEVIFRPDFEREVARKPEPQKALVDRTGDVLRVGSGHPELVASQTKGCIHD
jgi:hypothetical protein